MAKLNWFLLRTMLVFSPAVVIAGIATLVQGRTAGGLLLLAIAAVMFVAGYRTKGQRLPP